MTALQSFELSKLFSWQQGVNFSEDLSPQDTFVTTQISNSDKTVYTNMSPYFTVSEL